MARRSLPGVARGAAFVVLAGCAGQAPKPDLVEVQVATVPASATPPVPARAPFEFTPDPTLDGLDPVEEPAFRQETWTGAGERQQHCRELAFPKRASADILAEVNNALTKRGVAGDLPKTVRSAPLVVAFGDFPPAFIQPAEPLVKLLLCTEGALPRALRDRFVDDLRADPLAPDFDFGEPSVGWRRVYADGQEEIGLSWPNVDDAKVKEVLPSRGYREEQPSRWMHEGRRMNVRLRGHQPWWTAVRGEAKTPR